nr:MAG TPA: hypothetical protein [Caudoviricetes sp.]
MQKLSKYGFRNLNEISKILTAVSAGNETTEFDFHIGLRVFSPPRKLKRIVLNKKPDLFRVLQNLDQIIREQPEFCQTCRLSLLDFKLQPNSNIHKYLNFEGQETYIKLKRNN